MTIFNKQFLTELHRNDTLHETDENDSDELSDEDAELRRQIKKSMQYQKGENVIYQDNDNELGL